LAVTKPVAELSLLGVGIDMEECAALRRLDDASVERAAQRWLTDKERDWCAKQDPFADALLVVLSCKEAVFKASNQGRVAHQVRLAVAGCCVRGEGWAEQSAVPIRVVWRRWRNQVVTLAVATAGVREVSSTDPTSSLISRSLEGLTGA
jgi:phosphopantetheinyl transferase (holo-ACP synthase)